MCAVFALWASGSRAETIAQCQSDYDAILAKMKAGKGSEVSDAALGWALDFEKAKKAGASTCPPKPSDLPAAEAGPSRMATKADLAVKQAQERAKLASAEVLDRIGRFESGFDAFDAGRLEDARRIFTRLCEEDHAGGCFEQSLMVGKGQGGERNDILSFDLMEKACKLGHPRGCELDSQIKAIRARTGE